MTRVVTGWPGAKPDGDPATVQRPLRLLPAPAGRRGGDLWATVAKGQAGSSPAASFDQFGQVVDETLEDVGSARRGARSPVSPRRAIWPGVVTVAAVALTACGAGVSGSAPATTHSAAQSPPSIPHTSPSSPADVARRQAIAAYLGMWRNFADAAATSDWRSPELAQNATGDALSVLSRTMYADHYNGLASRGQPVNNPRVSSVEPADAPTTVMVSDCGDDSHWLKYRADNGQLADDTPAGRRAITAEVKLARDGTWKVTRFAVEAVGTC
jgi:hypothetical protein